MTRRPVVVDDLTRLRWPVDPAMRSDGTAVAYVVSGPDASTDRLTHTLHLSGLPDGGSRRIGAGPADRAPRWSPDGTHLAYRAGPALVVVDADGAAVPSPVIDGTVRDHAWDPAGDRIAFVVDPVAGTQTGPWEVSGEARAVGGVRILDLAGGGLSEVAPLPPGTPTAVRWSRTGALAVSLDGPAPPAGSLVVLGPDGDVWAEWGTWDGPVRALAWSPDGTSLAAIVRPGAAGWVNQELWVWGPDDGGRRLAADLDRSIGQVVRGDDDRGIGSPDLDWTPDGSAVMAAWAEGGTSRLGAFGVDGSRRDVLTGDRAVLSFSVAARSGAVAFSWSDPVHPGVLSWSDGDTESILTDPNGAWCDEVELVGAAPLVAESVDGARIEGWLTTPSDPTGGPVPLVVQVHGGPHYPVGRRFSFDAERTAAAGMAFLRGNPRGSQGYGEGHARAIADDWGGVDLADLLALVEEASTDPGVDGSRVAIIGESYGGFLSATAAVRSDRFAAVVAENAIWDMLSIASGPNGAGFWQVEMEAVPWSDPTPFLERSPLYGIDAVRVPVLLIHAEDDTNVPVTQSEAAFRALQATGADVGFVRIPGEGHMVNVTGRPSNRIGRIRLLDRFLRTRLGTVGHGTERSDASRDGSES